jgi:hypothetical protein
MRQSNENNKLYTIYSVMARLLVFGLVWVGIYHIYTTVLDTYRAWWLDAALAGMAVGNIFYNKGLCEWFKNVP